MNGSNNSNNNNNNANPAGLLTVPCGSCFD